MAGRAERPHDRSPPLSCCRRAGWSGASEPIPPRRRRNRGGARFSRRSRPWSRGRGRSARAPLPGQPQGLPFGRRRGPARGSWRGAVVFGGVCITSGGSARSSTGTAAMSAICSRQRRMTRRSARSTSSSTIRNARGRAATGHWPCRPPVRSRPAPSSAPWRARARAARRAHADQQQAQRLCRGAAGGAAPGTASRWSDDRARRSSLVISRS